MKKILSIMIVLVIVATTAFATDFNLNLGLGYNYNSGKIAKKAGYTLEDAKMRYGGFDVQLGFNAELNNHLVIYDNIDFVFPGKLETNNKTQDKWLETKGLDSKFQVNEDLGVGYAFHFNTFRLIVGGGLHVDYLMYKYKSSSGLKTDTNTRAHVGLNIMAMGDYMFSEHVGIMFALKPSVNFFNSWKDKMVSPNVDSSEGALSFNGSAVVGATFKF